MNDIVKQLENLLADIKDLQSKVNVNQKQQRILELEDKMQIDGFWNHNETAQKITQEHNDLKTFVDFWASLEKSTIELIELIKSNTDESTNTLTYLKQQAEEVQKLYNDNRLVLLLSKKYDDHNAVFSIHAGAGGTDAQDWADMLLRMIMRYCERKNFKTET
jgi:peptide chain release factor 2